MRNFRMIGIGFVMLMVGLAVIGCSSGKKAIQIKGSDTMVNLGQAWAEEFMKLHPKNAVAVTGGGSGVGIAALLSGTTDIAQASRKMKQKEYTIAKEKGIDPREFHVANDGITLVVHPSNPVSKLTIKQLSDLYTGKITNWQQLGGADKKIVALSRDRNSGTHVFFLEHVVKLGSSKNQNEFAPSVLMMPSNQAIVEEVKSNPSAIGYIGLGYLTDELKALAIARKSGSAYVLPSIKTVTSGWYPVGRSLQFYTNGVPSGEAKSFIDFVLSPAGQDVVLKMDFVPVK